LIYSVILCNEISVLEEMDSEPLEILGRAPRNTIWEALYQIVFSWHKNDWWLQ